MHNGLIGHYEPPLPCTGKPLRNENDGRMLTACIRGPADQHMASRGTHGVDEEGRVEEKVGVAQIWWLAALFAYLADLRGLQALLLWETTTKMISDTTPSAQRKPHDKFQDSTYCTRLAGLV